MILDGGDVITVSTDRKIKRKNTVRKKEFRVVGHGPENVGARGESVFQAQTAGLIDIGNIMGMG